MGAIQKKLQVNNGLLCFKCHINLPGLTNAKDIIVKKESRGTI